MEIPKLPKYIMNKNSKDVCFLVLGFRYGFDLKPVYIGKWVNLGYAGEPFEISEIENIYIDCKYLQDWIELTQEQVEKPRTKPGLPE